MKNFTLIIFCLVLESKISFSQIWLPLEVNNRWQYLTSTVRRLGPSSFVYSYSFLTASINNKIDYNGKNYYSMNGFMDFPNNTLVSYDSISSRILILKNNIEYLYMDFSQPDSTYITTIKSDFSFHSVMVISEERVIGNDTLVAKGFYDPGLQPLTGYSGKYFFVPNIGFFNQIESITTLWGGSINKSLIEYLLISNTGDTTHFKHSQVPSIDFQPILTLADSIYLKQDFNINHSFSVITVGTQGGRSYIDQAFFQYFYSNGTDTIGNNQQMISQINEIKFSLNYLIDTSLSIQGYYLYYRIYVKDKGIIPSYFLKPDSGYYKLNWSSTPVLVDDEIGLPTNFKLEQNYPNPFNPITIIRYQLPKESRVSVKVFDILGKEVEVLVDELQDAGHKQIEFNGSSLASGFYIYKLITEEYSASRKMMILK